MSSLETSSLNGDMEGVSMILLRRSSPCITMEIQKVPFMADDDFDSLHRTHDGTEYLYGRGDYSEYLICNVSDVALTDFILEENDLCVLESNAAA